VIKLLVADDSALMRKLLEGIFLAQGDFEIMFARNGTEALELVRAFKPDVVTLDVQMPGMDGLSCLARIMLESPRPVVMISSLTEEGADATLEAMDLGAVDFIAKPSGAISLEIDTLEPILVAKIRNAAKVRINPALRLRDRIRHQFEAAPGPMKRPRRSAKAPAEGAQGPGLVLIGTSTGGPAALDIVLPQLPADFPWPVVVAQHMPAAFTNSFAKRLDRYCGLRVVEVGRPTPLEPGTVYIGRGDADVIVGKRAKAIVAMPAPAKPDYPWHPSVERMVDTAMECYDAQRLLGVMLTGMGNDGAEAMSRLKAAGGHTIAQSEDSAVVWGMPGELVKAGGAGEVAAIEKIAGLIMEAVAVDASR
jgi:two-component system chemotaxis response regulator CheB